MVNVLKIFFTRDHESEPLFFFFFCFFDFFRRLIFVGSIVKGIPSILTRINTIFSESATPLMLKIIPCRISITPPSVSRMNTTLTNARQARNNSKTSNMMSTTITH